MEEEEEVGEGVQCERSWGQRGRAQGTEVLRSGDKIRLAQPGRQRTAV